MNAHASWARRSAFTLTEVLISSLVLSLFLGGAFLLFRTGANSFSGGSWRAIEQKKIQLFLEELVRDLEQASGRIIKIQANGSNVGWNGVPGGTPTPIYINNLVYSANTAAKKYSLDQSNWVCLMVFNVTRPWKENNATFGTPLERGKWTGVSLWARNREIRYIRSGSRATWDATPQAFPAGITTPAPANVVAGGDFEPGTENIHDRIVDATFDDLSILGSGTPVVSLEIRTTTTRRVHGTANTSFEEAAVAKLASGTSVTTF